MRKLGERLQAVADFVTNFDIVIDIGTDHGYLPIYLLMNKKVKLAFATDIMKGPLLQAEKNIAKYKLSDKINLVQCGGLTDELLGRAFAAEKSPEVENSVQSITAEKSPEVANSVQSTTAAKIPEVENSVQSDSELAAEENKVCVTISGLGGETILSIIRPVFGATYVLQPQSKQELFVSELSAREYKILDKKEVQDKNHKYFIYKAVYKGKT
ncbi:MAG: class I SAM-dependent methyltransferase [Ruminococcus sp.]|nr:class I SAM-dependent methyltransferase [Ruminococcus sp.]